MKSAFVTGASQGLGLGFVNCLLQKGYIVFGGARALSRALPQHSNLHWVPLELTSNDSIRRAFETVAARVETVDLLINNAGVNKDTATGNRKDLVSDLRKLDRKFMLLMYEINALAPIMVTKQFLPLLTGHPSFVINISSCRASFHDKESGNYKGNYGYRASKIALNMLTFCSVLDFRKNVKTFSVHPGDVRSAMNPLGTEEPVAQAEKILAIREHWDDRHNGLFLNYDGTLYPL